MFNRKVFKGLEQKSFISEQNIMWIYKILVQEVLQKKKEGQKRKSTEHLTFQDVFKKLKIDLLTKVKILALIVQLQALFMQRKY
jgi:hypothetical protein